ncbi:nucleoside recognition domain-containing protein [Flexibacterium corallicola]|uniref:nucleoside recognition domain-containing protein n=1 Tax=Flexibacterium corallicola TaxID=3037259 RepID=UPI00286EF6CB|nr:nucleoside recognition domain-containing protein [Pseudovibrio sp. M1P-2-3]
MNDIVASAKKLFLDSLSLFWTLLKIMVPVMVLVRAGQEIGLIDYLAKGLGPVMGIFGLPAEAALVLATGLLVGNYGAVAILVTLLPGSEFSVADVTVLLSIILIAHNMPIEQSVARKAGLSALYSTGFRLIVGLSYGLALHLFYSATNMLQYPVDLSWLPFTPKLEETWVEWTLSSTSFLFSLFWIILGLIILLRAFEALKITDFLSWLLSPLLRLMGISKQATPITMIGVLLGIAYGGGLIIREAQKGKLSPKEVVLSMSFMCICHGLIEDPLIMVTFGAHWTAAFIGRFVFCVVVMIIICRVVQKLPESTFNRTFYRAPQLAT